MASSGPKTYEWPGLATWFDARSPVDQVPWGRWRYLQNIHTDAQRGWGRRNGFKRYGAGHRRPDGADLKGSSAPITSLYSHVSPRGFRRLYAATDEIVVSQGFDGHWTTREVLAAGHRARFASLNDLVVVVNGVDHVKAQVVDGPTFDLISDLTTIGLTSARGVTEWKGCLFLWDVEMDGVRLTNRVLWSDHQDGLSWVPSTDSIAGFQDLAPGETILAAVPLVDALFLFTTHSIWRVTATGDENAFGFQHLYYHRDGEACLRGRFSYAVLRDTVVYLSHDSLYLFNAFASAPERPEWLYQSGLELVLSDPTLCDDVTACYHSMTEEVWFSYAAAGSTTPNRTLCLNLRLQSADIQDHGWWSLLSCQIDQRESFYEWMIRVAGCSKASLSALWPTDSFPDAAGFATTLDEVCDQFPSCPACNAAPVLLGVSATDNCLKQEDRTVFYREFWQGGTTYTQTGYASRALTGCLRFGTPDWKRLSEINASVLSVPETTPKSIAVAVTVSSVPVDKLDSSACFSRTFQLSQKSLACRVNTGSQPLLPNDHMDWKCLVEGRFLIFDWTVDSSTGAAFWLSRFAITIERSPNSSP